MAKRSRGYRRIPGNGCSPALDSYEPELVPCTKEKGKEVISSSSAWVAVVIILLVLGALAGAAVYLYKSNEKFYRYVRQLQLPCLRKKAPVAYATMADDDDMLDDVGDY